jgi:hypothetical protein
VAFPVDATLGVDGTPQSGTGQASFLTGLNAARSFGRHFGPWIPTGLRDDVRNRNLLVRAIEAGHRAAFANAYPPGWPGERSRRRIAGPPLAALGAGLLTRHAEHLARGEAVSSEIVNDGWIRHLGPADLPRPTPTEAGRALGRIAAPGGLTMYAHYATDTAGHRGDLGAGVFALERVDAFLGGLLDTLPARHRVAVVSDHGNLEDVETGHTRNPALGLIVGASGPTDAKAEEAAAALASLVHVPDAVLGLLN